MWQKIIKDKRILGGLALLVIVAAVPLTLNLASREQDIRQRASGPTSCSVNNPIDTMLIIDKSGSMGPPVNTDDRITPAKAAAKKFVNILYQNGLTASKKSKAGVVSFAQLTNSTEGTTTLDSPLITLTAQSNADAVNAKIDSIKIFGRTCTQCGIRLANEEIAAHDRTGVQKVVVLLTDGGANAYDGHLTATQTEAEKAANDEVDKGHAASGTIFFTIGLGKDVNTKFLQNIATRTGGKYFFAPTAASLDQIYQQISTIVGKGNVSGKVYNDANGNKIQDATDAGQTGWKVDLLNATNQTIVASTTTDDQGNYTFPGVCDGAYQVKLTVQSSWTLTTPTDPEYLNLSVANGNTVADQNFGVKQEVKRTTLSCSPADITLTTTNQAITATLLDSANTPMSGKTITWTPTGPGWPPTIQSVTTSTTSPTGIATTNISVPANTPGFSGGITASYAGDAQNGDAGCSIHVVFAPQATTLTVTVLLHGIGSSGDNVNPDNPSSSNKNPVHTNRNLIVTIFDTKDNKQVEEINNTNLAYDTTKGSYSSTINLTSIASGRYIVQIKTDYHLRKQFPGAIQITANQNNILTPITLVAGDVDNNNQIDMGDYNALIDCYSDYEPPVACDEQKKLSTDLNDDGKVEQFDYNLLLREWLVQNGDVVGT